jgi:N utilization substance protein B
VPVRAETRARALALQLLYAWDLAGAPPGAPDTTWGRMIALARGGPRVEERALKLAERAVARHAELDRAIQAAAEQWRLERLGVVDRNVLRLAILELLERETPPKVALDEAVRLARWFGGPKSPGFVNGVLDRVARDLGRL